MLTRLVNLHWTEPEDRRHDVYIGRPSIWGNPYVVGRDGTREQVIARHTELVLGQPDFVTRIRRELTGKVLGCYCAPRPCHGDLYVAICNSPRVVQSGPCGVLYEGEVCSHGTCSRPPGHDGRCSAFDGPAPSDAVPLHPNLRGWL